MHSNTVLLYTAYFVSIVHFIVGVPLALNMIEPNGWYGIRIAKTFESTEAWYSVNSLGGYAFVIAGLLSIIIIFMLNKNWQSDGQFKGLTMVFTPIVLSILGIIYAIKAG